MWFWHRWFTKEGWQIRRQNVIAMVYMDSTPSELFEVFIAASLLDTLVKPCRLVRHAHRLHEFPGQEDTALLIVTCG
jgi:hypothetical protein